MPTPLNLDAISSAKIATYCQEHGCELLNKTSLEKLFRKLEQELAILNRQNNLTEAQKTRSKELQFTKLLVQALALKATSSVSSVHELLAQCDMNEESEVVSKIAVTVWVNRLHDLLEGEAYPLALFVMMKDLLLDTPVIFSAVLHYLFAQSIAIDDIIQSGLLHQYFVGHNFEMSKVEQVYSFLSNNYWHQDAIPVFLKKISKISMLDTGLENYSLNGTCSSEDLKRVYIVNLVYPWTIDKAYFDKLFQFFGFSFLVATFQHLDSVPDTRWNAILVSTLGAFSIDDVKQLYGYVYRSVPAESRQALFSKINPYFSDEVILELFTIGNVSVPVWSILSSKSSLAFKLDIGCLKSMISSAKANEIQQAFNLSSLEPFQREKLDSLIYLRIAELLLEQSGLFIEKEIYSKLLADNVVQTWLKNKAQEYREAMANAMDCLRWGFTEERYDALCDFMRTTQPSYQALQKMSQTKLDLPLDNHQRDGWILAYSYLLSSETLSVEHVNGVLAIMQKLDSGYTSEELGRWKGRILLESLLTSFITDELRNFLWKESDCLGLWKQMLTANNLGCVLMSLADESFKTGLSSIANEIESSLKIADDLGVILRPLNEGQCKQFLAAVQGQLSDIINYGKQLPYALRLLNETQRGVLLAVVQGQLSDIIKDGEQLCDVLSYLNETQRGELLAAVQGQLSDIIEDGHQLRNVLSYLNETQRGELLAAVQGQLSDIIKDAAYLNCVLMCLSGMQCGVLLEAVQGKLSDIIKDGAQLGRALSYLNETQGAVLLAAVQCQISDIIKDGAEFGCALRYLNETQRGVLFAVVQGQLSNIIKDGTQLGDALMYLNETQRGVLLEAVQGKLSDIIKDVTQLGRALSYLNETQRGVLLAVVQGQLSDIIKDGEQLRDVLSYLNETQRGVLLAAVQGKLSDIIKDGEQLCRALRYLNETQRGVLFAAVCDIIKNGEQLGYFLSYLNETQCGVLLEVIQSKLSGIINNGWNLSTVIIRLGRTKRGVFLAAVQSKLSDIIKDGEQLGYILGFLNQAQCVVLLDAIQGNLSTIIHNGKILTDVLSQTESRHFMPILKRLENDLPNIISSVDELDAVINALKNNSTEINMVLEAMKGRLPHLLKATSDVKNADLSKILKDTCCIINKCYRRTIRCLIIHVTEQRRY